MESSHSKVFLVGPVSKIWNSEKESVIDRVGEPTAETNKRLAANKKNSRDPPE